MEGQEPGQSPLIIAHRSNGVTKHPPRPNAFGSHSPDSSGNGRTVDFSTARGGGPYEVQSEFLEKRFTFRFMAPCVVVLLLYP